MRNWRKAVEYGAAAAELVLVALWLVGCSLLPMKRQEQEGLKAGQQIATEHELTVRAALAGTVGAGGVEAWEVRDRASVAGASHEEAKAWYKQSVPLWVTLCFGGVGILICVFAVKYARRSSPAIDEAWGWADQAVAGVVRSMRTKAAGSSSDGERATLMAHVAELEGERGRMRPGK